MVVVDQVELIEDLDAEPVGAQHGEQLGVTNLVAGNVGGHQDDQAPVDAADDVEVGALMLAGSPDHSPDIFPALMMRPRSASIRCSSLAFQRPLAVA